MTEASLADGGIGVRDEPAVAVCGKRGEIDGAEHVLFPHIQGGIPVASVTAAHVVVRDRKGRFTDIDLCVDIL